MKKHHAVPRLRLLRSLNLFGLDHLDAVVLAALADERPLLLIGPHGAAKSELLNRLAAGLGLSHRHYNASLISFDDLLGYPVPNAARDALEYLRTPGDLWDAESILLDEISRCRPENQNKLFSVIHEKRVQGLALERLRYRWAAMNPPATGEQEPEETIYEGSVALDPALADRFAWVAVLPALIDLSPKERLALIREGGEAPSQPPDLPALVGATRERIASCGGGLPEWSAKYVEALVAPLEEAGLGISGRRAVALARGIPALAAACEVLGIEQDPGEAAYAVLRCGLPQRAQGRQIEEGKLLALHRLAVQTVGEPEDSPWRAIRREIDPVRRIVRAIAHHPDPVSRHDLSAMVSDTFASFSLPRRYLLARHLAPVAARTGCLNAPAFGLLAEPLEKLRAFCSSPEHRIAVERSRMAKWNALLAAAAALEKRGAEGAQLGNLMLALYAIEHQEVDSQALVALDAEWSALFAELGRAA